jgi:hypothetical protein
MENKSFDVNIDSDAVREQYEKEQVVEKPRKTQFDTKNYLQARLDENEQTKTLTIRLLPFSPKGGSPFFKVHMHTVRVNKEVSPRGWKTFVCPTKNKKDGQVMGERCPFCDLSAKAKELKFKSLDEPTKKKYGDIEFMNKAKESWIVRCIERGHEEDGVKFWLFASSKKKDGVYDKIMNLANQRAASAAKKGNKYSIFDLNNGMDLIITLTRTSDGKTSVQVIDEGMPSPLTDDFDLGMKWINDSKQWNDVYTVKSPEYMEIIAGGGVPVYNKDLGRYVDKEESVKVKEEADRQRLEETITTPTKDFSDIAESSGVNIVDGNDVKDDDEDLPF